MTTTSASPRPLRPAPSIRRSGVESAADVSNGAALRLRSAPVGGRSPVAENEAETFDAIQSRMAAPGRTPADISLDYPSPTTVGVFQRSRRKKRREERLRRQRRPRRSPPEVDTSPPVDDTTSSSSPSIDERLSGTPSFNDEEKRYDGQCVLVCFQKVDLLTISCRSLAGL